MARIRSLPGGRDASWRPSRFPGNPCARPPPSAWRAWAPMDLPRWHCSAGHLVRSTGPGSLDDVEVYHDRIRETVIKHLSPEVLKTWHGELRGSYRTPACRFRDSGGPFRSGRYARDGRAVLRTGCRQGRQGPRFRPRGQALSAGPRLWPTPGEAGRPLRIELANALANAGRGVEAARAYQDAATRADGVEVIQLQSRAAYQFLISGHIDEGLATFDRCWPRSACDYPARRGVRC